MSLCLDFPETQRMQRRRRYRAWWRIGTRIVGVGDVIAGNPASRYITLHGADWPLTLTSGHPMFATIVDGVTGVYQKTITLDGSSSWQQ